MSLSIEMRQVDREVAVYRCDRCKVEAVEDAAVGWMCCALLERMRDPMTGRNILGSSTASKMQIACPACTAVLVAAMNSGAVPAIPESPSAPSLAPGEPFPALPTDWAERIRLGDLARAAERAQMSTILHTIGGFVEGRPTLAINYLQRLRQLVDIEREHQRCKNLERVRVG